MSQFSPVSILLPLVKDRQTSYSPAVVKSFTNEDIKDLLDVTLPSEAAGCQITYTDSNGYSRKALSTMTAEAITLVRNNNLAEMYASGALTAEIVFNPAASTVTEVTGVWTRRVYVEIRDAETGALLTFVNGLEDTILSVADDSVAGTASIAGNVSGNADALQFTNGIAYFDVSGSNHAWVADEEVTATVAAFTPNGYGVEIATADHVTTIVAA